jgi:prepilin-type N-terminal cleavage/methylation domain-containing protein
MMKKQTLGHMRGFTLIELLVVIAIIGILASVVLASLNTARDKGADAAVKSNLNGMRAQAELFYDTGATYTSVCANTNMTNALAAASDAVQVTPTVGGLGDVECNSTASAWSAWANLKASDAYYCVDSTGNSKVTATRISSSATALTACP